MDWTLAAPPAFRSGQGERFDRMSLETASPPPAPDGGGGLIAFSRRAAAPLFTVALFSSAALIFVLQPLFARMATPLLGGSPQVWNTSMAFFQAALLIGYLYAHLLARVKDVRIQAGVHIAVLALAWFVLPVQVSEALGPPSSDHPALWLLGVLALSVGAPFAAASATAPLLQAWYARTGRADAGDPYYLYAASNLGSFIGLLAYPVLIEPLLGAHAQSAAWSNAYAFVGVLIAAAAALTVTAHGQAPTQAPPTSAPIDWRQRAYWIAAAAVPSALSLGVTLHITTDVASAPMLWVAPLALYLATFVLAFMRGAERLAPATFLVHPFAIALMVISYYMSGNWVFSVSLILAGFFFSALVCHLALSRSRPAADRLTEFYLYVSLGGVLGGVFAALLAPVMFNNVYEYPLALAAACLFRPREPSAMPRLSDASLGAAGAMAIAALLLMRLNALDATIWVMVLGAAVIVLAIGWNEAGKPAPLRYAIIAVAVVHAGMAVYALYTLAFGQDAIFVHSVINNDAVLSIRQPWPALFVITSIFLLGVAVHGTIQRGSDRVADIAYGASIPSLVLVLLLVLLRERLDAQSIVVIGICICAVAIFLNRGRPMVLAAIVLVSFFVIFLDDARGVRIITQERTFFGVLRTRVIEDRDDAQIPPVRILMHGTTIHGAQIAAPGLSRLPLTYYNPGTALGEAILAGLSTAESADLALVGLGAGSTACLMRPDDRLTIYEIDPEVVRLSTARDGDFSYVAQCQPNARVELGDARLRIAAAPDASYDVIVVDAFSSDAIPAHLLTREAVALYLSKLRPTGVLVLHLSNRNLALVAEAARVARDLNAPHLHRISDRFEVQYVSYYGGLAASAMMITRSPEVLARLPLPSNEWRVLEALPGQGWSDDYINMPRALWEGLSGRERCWLHPHLEECGGEAADTPRAPG